MNEPSLAIVNPRAGRGAGRAQRIIRRLELAGQPVVLTERAGHATELAAGSRDYQCIVAVGGDGTVFEVLQGMDVATQSLVVLPAGRANTLARDLSREPRRMDLLDVEFADARGASRRVRSASTVAVGYPVAVAAMADRTFHFLGAGCYGAAALLTAPVALDATVAYDGGRPSMYRLTGLLINNTRYVANFRALSRASVTDGQFDAMELRRAFAGQLAHNVSAMLRLPYEPVRPIRGHSMSASFGEPHALVVDGEFYRDVVSMTVRVLPGAVNCARL